VIILIRHVPPEKPEVQLSADWMRKPVADMANNWVQVQKMENGKYLAAVGKETFDVEIKTSLTEGKILSGNIGISEVAKVDSAITRNLMRRRTGKPGWAR
jgi:hypothetical protein